MRLGSTAVLLTLTGGLVLPGHADASSTLTVSQPFGAGTSAYSYDLVMAADVSAVTVDANPSGTGFRIRETGTLTLSQPSGGPCQQPTGSSTIVCTSIPINGGMTITNTGGSTAPPARDQVIMAGVAHGDPPASSSPISASVTSTNGLIEVYAANAGGFVRGSDVATGSAAQPADIVHSGPGGLFCINAATNNLCDLGAGADRLEGGTGNDAVTGGAGADVLLGGGGDDTLGGGPGDDLVAPGAANDVVTGDDGDDTLSFDDPARTMGLVGTWASGTPGTLGTSPYDTATSTGLGARTGTGDSYDGTFEHLVASPQADRITGGAGIERIDGAGGDDVLRGGTGSDVLAGGPGVDTVDYGERGADRPVTVTLDGFQVGGNATDDGAAGDTLSGFESATGGAGDDVLTGSDAANTLIGGAGADRLTGLGGVDAFFGGDGDDELRAKDGLAEVLECGAGADRIDADAVDEPRDCDLPPAAPPPDTTTQPAAPPAPPPPDVPSPGPSAPVLIAAKVVPRFSVAPAGTRVRALDVTGVPTGATIEVRCASAKRRACPFRKQKRTTAKAGKVRLGGLFGSRRLPVGTVITVRVSAPGVVGKQLRFTIGRRKVRTSRLTCLTPAGAVTACA